LIALAGGAGVQFTQQAPELAQLFKSESLRMSTVEGDDSILVDNSLGSKLVRGGVASLPYGALTVDLDQHIASKATELAKKSHPQSTAPPVKGAYQQLAALVVFENAIANKAKAKVIDTALAAKNQPIVKSIAKAMRFDRQVEKSVERTFEKPKKRSIDHSNWMTSAKAYLQADGPKSRIFRTKPSRDVVQAIDAAAKKNGVPTVLLLSLAEQESNFRPQVVSSVGAVGLCQVLPSTAAWLLKKNHKDPSVLADMETKLKDPKFNADVGARYLVHLAQQFNGNVTLMLAAYNAGPGAVKKHNGIPPYDETMAYVEKIKARILINTVESLDQHLDNRLKQASKVEDNGLQEIAQADNFGI
jgi:soluble lytic murein transglycosylase-like protein